MNSRQVCLSLLALVVVTSGCLGPSEETESEGPGSIEVHELSVNPQQVYSGSSIRAVLEFANIGNTPAEINVNEEDASTMEGKRVLTDHCPDIFTIDQFQTNPNEMEQGEITLQPKESASIQWTLEQEGRVPLYGHSCNLKFQIPFEYSVTGYRQVQIKESDDVEGSTLTSETSKGPLRLLIETVGGTGQEGRSTFVQGTDEEMRILLQFRNNPVEDYNKGLVDIDEGSFYIEAPELGIEREEFISSEEESVDCDSDGSKFRCVTEIEEEFEWVAADGDPECELDNNNPIRVSEGQSRVMKCDIDISEIDLDESPSIVSEIRAGVDYSYIKDLGSRQIRVESRGR